MPWSARFSRGRLVLHPVKPPSASEGNAVTTMTTKDEAPKAETCEDPINVEQIGDSTESALVMELGTTTRDDIDSKTPTLIGHLQLLMGEELGADEDEMVRHLFHKAYGLLDLKNRPTPETPVFTAFFFMREVAALTRRFLWIYTQRSGMS
jgi:hypothetical protein